MNITSKQDRFYNEYVIDFNATQAAIRAGYSKKTAYSIGQRLLKNVEIQNRICELKKQLSAKNLWSREQSIKTLVNIVEGFVIIDGQEVKAQNKDIIAAVIQLNLMHGYNEPIKTQQVGEDGRPVVNNPTLIRIVGG